MDLKLHQNTETLLKQTETVNYEKENLLSKIIPLSHIDWTLNFPSFVSYASSLAIFETIRHGSQLWLPRLLEGVLFFSIVLTIIVIAAMS